MKYTFAIDCDEVLRALLDNMILLYNKEFGENLTRDDIKDFKVEYSFPKVEEVTRMKTSRWFFQEHSKELFACSPAFPQIKEDIEKLQEYGEVIIVTYQKSYQNKIDTLNWLQDNGLAPDGICFIRNKTLIHTDFLIDDNDWNFVGCNAKYGILIDAPYNKDLDLGELGEKANCKKMCRYSSLHEIVEDFVEKEKFKEAIKHTFGGTPIIVRENKLTNF